MFVKVICRVPTPAKEINGEVVPGKLNKHESLYECSRVHIHPTDNGDIVLFELEGNDDITVEVKQSITEVYILNENGRTIDRYNWEEGF